VNTTNNNVIPDLKRSPYTNNAAAWKTVVIDGGLAHLGMISWSHYISPDQAESIRHYVQSQARKALTNPLPPNPRGQPPRSLTPTEAATQGGP